MPKLQAHFPEDARPTEPVPPVVLDNLDVDLEALDPDTDECDSDDGRLTPLASIESWAREISVNPAAATHIWRGS